MRIILPLFVVDVFRFPLVLWLGCSVVMSDRNTAERLYSARETEEFCKRSCKFHIRVDTGPYGAKSQGFSCKQYVLSRSGAVLLPVSVLSAFEPGSLTADNDCKRSLLQHFCIRQYLRHSVKSCSFCYHDKSPRLVVDCCRSCHRSLEHSLDVLL